MKFTDAELHSRGEAPFIDDLPLPADTLFAAVCPSPLAHARLSRLDTRNAEAVPGVVRIFTAADIPGANQIGNVVQDEPLLPAAEVHYAGQPVALVVAADAHTARRAAGLIAVEAEALPAIFDPREAYRQGQLIGPERRFVLGDVEAAWGQCDIIVTGRVDSGPQEHVYFETQTALAIPAENGTLKIFSATQAPALVQRMVAQVLGCPMHQVEVEVPRLGGAFGGKEEQATAWAALAALAAHHLRRPVKLALRRGEDMRMTGKRHPYSADFRLGLRTDGQILACEVHFYQDAGAVADLSLAVLERSLCHATGGYFIPHVRITAASCRTHLPPNTACRGFGAPQAVFIIESAIYEAARALRVAPGELQRRNLLQEGDRLPYGMQVSHCRLRRCWEEAERLFELERKRAAAAAFNATQTRYKKGLALLPLCFGISFSQTLLNQASALVHVYTDGSVSVSTGAVELGQGVRRKLQQLVAGLFALKPERVKVEPTSTARIANMSPTAASTGADLNGQAARMACVAVLDRLKTVAAAALGTAAERLELRNEAVYCDGEQTELDWLGLIRLAYSQRVSLSSHAFYATPGIWFDRQREQGQPFAYHVFGVGLIEATVDGLRGTYQIDAVHVLHDAGQSLNPLIDRGQVEGGVVQGLGWMTLEELQYDPAGRLATADLTTYKIPDIHFAPPVAVHFLEQAANPVGLLGSKAIGEPPFLYGIGAYFALLQALQAFRPDLPLRYQAPLTPEKVLAMLYTDK